MNDWHGEQFEEFKSPAVMPADFGEGVVPVKEDLTAPKN